MPEDADSREAKVLNAMAREAIRLWDIPEPHVSLLTHHWNAIYTVRAGDGERYILRIGKPRVRSGIEVRSELFWLQSLNDETDMLLPKPLPAVDGRPFVTLRTGDSSTARYCALFTWLPGRTLRSKATPNSVEKLGGAMAALHHHADRFVAPLWFTDSRLDRVWTHSPLDPATSAETHPLLTPRLRDLVRRAAERTQAELDRLYENPSGARFLHADMHLGNAKLHQGTLGILDFDDSLWGFPVQDIGITLFHLARYAEPDQLPQAFRAGYNRIRAWPETYPGEVEHHINARLLDMIGLFASPENDREVESLGQMLAMAEGRFVD